MTDDGLTRRAQVLLGTIVEIAIPSANIDDFSIGFAAVSRVHQLMSFHEPASDLSRLRAALPDVVLELAPETVSVLGTSLMLYRMTGGLFDISIGRNLVANGFLPRDRTTRLSQFDGSPPDLEIIDASHVRLHRRMLIDLGGIAKGYAVDLAVTALTTAGVSHGIVNAGGDLRIFGDVQQCVALRSGNGELTHFTGLTDCAIASSENSRTRRRLRGRVTTPHVGLDGAPVVIDNLVSVRASTCVIADALTKVAMTNPAMANDILGNYAGYVMCSPQREACYNA